MDHFAPVKLSVLCEPLIYCRALLLHIYISSFPGDNTHGGGRSLEGGRVPSTAGRNQAVALVTRPDVENDQRKSTRTWHF